MNSVFKILVIVLLALICVLLIYTSVKANSSLIRICPVNAISQKGNIAVIDSFKCINCGRCFIGIPGPYNFTLFPNLLKKSKDTEAILKQPDIVLSQNTQKELPQVSDKTKSKPDNKLVTDLKTISKTFYKVTAGSCIGCQLCVPVCPTSAITMVNGKAVIDAEKCIACGICAIGNGNDYAGCPTSSISKVTESIPSK